MMLHRLAGFLAWYGVGLFLLYLIDSGENKRYRGWVGLRRLLLHGAFMLPITALIATYTPWCPIC